MIESNYQLPAPSPIAYQPPGYIHRPAPSPTISFQPAVFAATRPVNLPVLVPPTLAPTSLGGYAPQLLGFSYRDPGQIAIPRFNPAPQPPPPPIPPPQFQPQSGLIPLAPLIECERCNQAQESAAAAQQQADQSQQQAVQVEQQAKQTCSSCTAAVQNQVAQEVPPLAQKHLPPAMLPTGQPGVQEPSAGPGGLAPLIRNPAIEKPVSIPGAGFGAQPAPGPVLFTQREATGPGPTQDQVNNPVKICVACTSTIEAAKFLNGEPSECSVVA